jgi:histidyl-tRNA synthetase
MIAFKAIILGEAELAAGVVQLRDLATGEQSAVALDAIEAALG